MNYTARDIRRAIVHDAMEAGLAGLRHSATFGSCTTVPRDYLANRVREYRAVGVNNRELVAALAAMRCVHEVGS